jgi:hypothetical protein
MYAASTTAAMRACRTCCEALAGACAVVLAVVFSRVCGIGYPSVRKFDDHRSRSSIIVVQ